MRSAISMAASMLSGDAMSRHAMSSAYGLLLDRCGNDVNNVRKKDRFF